MEKQMNAAVLHRFGGPEEFRMEQVPLPEIAANEVLIKLQYSAVSSWDVFEREGGYAEMLGLEPSFPYILGSEGAGTVEAIGKDVDGFKKGDSVYTASFLNANGGTYAEYAAVGAQYVSLIPKSLGMREASAILGVGLTALRGLEDVLNLQKGGTILILGASGGVGHMAVQLAKMMGAEVIAVASSDDGVNLVQQLGIEKVVNGRSANALEQIKALVPNGIDNALFTAGGKLAQDLLELVRNEGCVAYPNGVQLDVNTAANLKVSSYNGEPEGEIIARLNHYIESKALTVHIAKEFQLEEIQAAHEALADHYSGKLIVGIDHE
ncbi:NADP-dependent oxidoreductase [Planococcus liqunii]|uniref:quinone oxidoreductase family protein n=1 Tax=Planococcus liqunii TaxID=3058394 RepID=UPI002623B336|nr:NADP-dependent oxidoreductase [Planococcus sp. N056]WKA52801.1 NADP-dependent oxidoreductase [Planococcus sp. N056]